MTAHAAVTALRLLVLALALALPAPALAADAAPPAAPAGETDAGPVVVLATGERLPCREAPTVAFGRVAYTSPDGVRHALSVALVDLEATREANRGVGHGAGPPAPTGGARPGSLPLKLEVVGGGGLAPDFAAVRADGTTVRLSDLHGKVVLIDFWATWCMPCVHEMPRVKALVQSLAGEDDFAILGVSLDRDRAALDAFVRKQGIDWPQAFDGAGWGNAVAAAYGVSAIPHVVIVGRDGRVAVDGVRRDLAGAVRALLDSPAPAPR